MWRGGAFHDKGRWSRKRPPCTLRLDGISVCLYVCVWRLRLARRRWRALRLLRLYGSEKGRPRGHHHDSIGPPKRTMADAFRACDGRSRQGRRRTRHSIKWEGEEDLAEGDSLIGRRFLFSPIRMHSVSFSRSKAALGLVACSTSVSTDRQDIQIYRQPYRRTYIYIGFQNQYQCSPHVSRLSLTDTLAPYLVPPPPTTITNPTGSINRTRTVSI